MNKKVSIIVILFISLLIVFTGCEKKEEKNIESVNSLNGVMLFDLEEYKDINIDSVLSIDTTKYTEGGDNNVNTSDREEIIGIYNNLKKTKIVDESSMACDDNTTVYTFNTEGKKYRFEFECNLLVLNNKRYTVETIEEQKEELVHIWENTVRTSNGFKDVKEISNGDYHFGWKLGKFVLTGFTQAVDNKCTNDCIFLKNSGDQLKLYFNLLQDIEKLNGDKNLKIYDEQKGYDDEFGVPKTKFGKGTLIVRKIDYNGNKQEPKIYTDYLKGVKVGANTEVLVLEEGDYEIALDYEIMRDNFSVFDGFEYYRIRFNFSVRNGNCMIFPIDVKTGNELQNSIMTENGFKVDMAKSRYLNVTIKKEVLVEGANGLTEDTRFNRPVKDGEEFTEDGIYTITAKNVYTSQITTKKIYVGNNSLLKAYMRTGKSIEEINYLVNKGATIDEDGNLHNLPEEKDKSSKKENDNTKDTSTEDNITSILIIVSVLAVITLVFIVSNVIKRKKEQKRIDEYIKMRRDEDNNKSKEENDFNDKENA